MARRRHLIWVCTVCLCPKILDARLIWVKKKRAEHPLWIGHCNFKLLKKQQLFCISWNSQRQVSQFSLIQLLLIIPCLFTLYLTVDILTWSWKLEIFPRTFGIWCRSPESGDLVNPNSLQTLLIWTENCCSRLSWKVKVLSTLTCWFFPFALWEFSHEGQKNQGIHCWAIQMIFPMIQIAKKWQAGGVLQQRNLVLFEIANTVKLFISRVIYFRDIREADIIAKINRRENLILPV